MDYYSADPTDQQHGVLEISSVLVWYQFCVQPFEISNTMKKI